MAEKKKIPTGITVIIIFLFFSIGIFLAGYATGKHQVFFGIVLDGLLGHVVFWVELAVYVALVVGLLRCYTYSGYLLLFLTAFNFLTDVTTYVKFALVAPESLPIGVTLVYLLFIMQSFLAFAYALSIWDYFFQTTDNVHKARDKTFSVGYGCIWILLLLYIGATAFGGAL